jgi:beta-glucanase (GH16 family)
MSRWLVWTAVSALVAACSGDVGMTATPAGAAGASSAGSSVPAAGTASPPAAGTTGARDAGCTSGPACPAAMRDAATATDAAQPSDAATRDATTSDAGPPPDAAPDAGDSGSEPDAERPGWTLTFREEYDGPAGTGIDTSKWTPVNRGDGFGNNELQFYTPRSENVRMDGDGSLIIEVLEENYMGRMYTSTRLESIGKFEQTYGRFEIRARLPFGQGIWPAFWLLGNDIGEVSWPQCGEIDIMEHVGRTPSTNYGSLHGPGYSGGNPLSQQYMLPGGARFADDFHEYAVEWERDVVRWYVDGNLYHTRTPDDVPQGGEWVYDHPFYMVLNVAVGGPFPGNPDDTTTFPQRLLVDYVRVYAREP